MFIDESTYKDMLEILLEAKDELENTRDLLKGQVSDDYNQLVDKLGDVISSANKYNRG